MVFFQNNGVKGVSMSELAKEIGVSKTTVYNHFESKEEILELALGYKLEVISEYESVLENITLPYQERYRKAMLFFCVQIFDVAQSLLPELKRFYPSIYSMVDDFQSRLFLNLVSYYQIGIDIGKFRSEFSPEFLAQQDQKFLEFLGEVSKENSEGVLPLFNQHYKLKFEGLMDPKNLLG